MRRNICVHLYIVETIFLPFAGGGIAFVLSAGCQARHSVLPIAQASITLFAGSSDISWETHGWVRCHCSSGSKGSICPADLALPPLSQC